MSSLAIALVFTAAPVLIALLAYPLGKHQASKDFPFLFSENNTLQSPPTHTSEPRLETPLLMEGLAEVSVRQYDDRFDVFIQDERIDSLAKTDGVSITDVLTFYHSTAEDCLCAEERMQLVLENLLPVKSLGKQRIEVREYSDRFDIYLDSLLTDSIPNEPGLSIEQVLDFYSNTTLI